jgi:hypothetical protein
MLFNTASKKASVDREWDGGGSEVGRRQGRQGTGCVAGARISIYFGVSPNYGTSNHCFPHKLQFGGFWVPWVPWVPPRQPHFSRATEHHVALGRCTMPLDFVAAVALWLKPQQR